MYKKFPLKPYDFYGNVFKSYGSNTQVRKNKVHFVNLSGSAQVLLDLFRHDNRLWTAYGATLQVFFSYSFTDNDIPQYSYAHLIVSFLDIHNLQSQPAFAEYHDLLEALEERLKCSDNLEEK